MQLKANKKIWIITGFVLGAILVLVIGFLPSIILVAGDPADHLDPIGDEPRNSPTTGADAIQAFTLEPGRMVVIQITNGKEISIREQCSKD